MSSFHFRLFPESKVSEGGDNIENDIELGQTNQPLSESGSGRSTPLVDASSTSASSIPVNENLKPHQAIVESHGFIAEQDARIGTLLSACSKNQVSTVLQILDSGLSPNACDYDSRSGLHLASAEGHLEIVQLLVQRGANVNFKDRFGLQPLDEAIRCGHNAVASYLRSHGATLGSFQSKSYTSSLLECVSRDDLESVRKFIEVGKIDVNCADYDKRTPLHVAVDEGNPRMVEYLLEKGANAFAVDRWGHSPFSESTHIQTRTGTNVISEIFNKYISKEKMQESGSQTKPSLSPFVFFVSFFFIAIIILFGLFVDYSEFAEGGSNPTDSTLQNVIHNIYPLFQDVHVMTFVGFGFLMTFLRANAYNGVGMALLIAAFILPWYILVDGFWEGAFNEFAEIKLQILSLLRADYCAVAALITYGAVLGKVSPLQIAVIAVIETIFYSLNEVIGREMGIADIGKSQVVHQFGAFFGLALSAVISVPSATFGNRNNTSVYHSDIFSMIGTLFLWIYFPSFNSASSLGAVQHRAIINTYFALTGSCVAAFIASYIFRRKHKFSMVDIQNATLAGGVAIGAAADSLLLPTSAMSVGVIAGFISVLGFVFLQPFFEKKLSLHDTCGIMNLHGLPSLLGGFVMVVASSQTTIDEYGPQLGFIWPKRVDGNELDRTGNNQAAHQFAFMVVTMAISIAAGLVTGFLIRHPGCGQRTEIKQMFSDVEDWETPHVETPYYFDHRGEAIRDEQFELTRIQEEGKKFALFQQQQQQQQEHLMMRLAVLEAKMLSQEQQQIAQEQQLLQQQQNSLLSQQQTTSAPSNTANLETTLRELLVKLSESSSLQQPSISQQQ